MVENTRIETVKETPLSWIVWGLGCLFYFYEFLLQVSPSVMSTQLMREFNVSAHALGILSGVYFYSYAGMQIPAGVLLDRLGPHKLLTFATAVCAISSIAFGMTDSLYMASVARFCIGFGSAFAVIGTMKFAANWFPPERFALLTGIMVAIGMSGAIGGESPLASFIHQFGWRQSMITLGISGIILTLLIFFVTSDKPKHAYIKKSNQKDMPLWLGLKQVVKNPQFWLVALYGGLMYTPTPVLCGLWGVPYLKQKYHLNDIHAAAIISWIFVGWIIGSPLWGYISDKIQRRLPSMLIGTIGSIITLSIVLYLPLPSLFAIKGLLFLFGLFSCGFLTAFSVAKEISSNKYCATAMSFMNMMNMVGVALAQPFIGRLLDGLWQGEFSNHGVRIYSTHSYELALSILPIGMFLSLLIIPFIKETYCQSKEDDLDTESKLNPSHLSHKL